MGHNVQHPLDSGNDEPSAGEGSVSATYQFPSGRRAPLAFHNALLAFLNEPGGEHRARSITVAVLEVVNEVSPTFTYIRSTTTNFSPIHLLPANIAPSATSRIECYAPTQPDDDEDIHPDDDICVDIFVDDRYITILDYRDLPELNLDHPGFDYRKDLPGLSQYKTLLADLLVHTPNAVDEDVDPEHAMLIERNWYTDINIPTYYFDVIEFANTALTYLPKEHRPLLLLAIGRELTRDDSSDHRRAWRRLLTAFRNETII